MTSTAVNLGSGLIGTLLTTWRPAQDSHVPRPVTSYHGLPCQRNIGQIVVIQSTLDAKTSCCAESLDAEPGGLPDRGTGTRSSGANEPGRSGHQDGPASHSASVDMPVNGAAPGAAPGRRPGQGPARPGHRRRPCR